MSADTTGLPEPTPDERKMAMLAHVLQLFTGLIAPLIIFFARRESKFVRFHALQPLILQSIVLGLTFISTAVFLLAYLATRSPTELPLSVYIFFGAYYLLWTANGLISLFCAIYFGRKAKEGSWVRYPVIGNLATSWSGI
jgi:uncharacterized membrane protein